MKNALTMPLISALALGLCACETASTLTGSADYDSLSRATADCTAQGGKLVLKDQGNAEHIQDYACKKD